jgi:hypothetical protein
MVTKNTVLGQPKSSNKRKVVTLTSHASQMLKSRGVTRTALMKALTSGTTKVDAKSGREVVRAGDLRLVIKRDGNTITVLTAMKADELSASA